MRFLRSRSIQSSDLHDGFVFESALSRSNTALVRSGVHEVLTKKTLIGRETVDGRPLEQPVSPTI